MKVKDFLGLTLVVSMAFACLFVSCDKPEPSAGKEDDKGSISDGLDFNYSSPDTILIDNDFPVPHPELPLAIHDGFKGKIELNDDAVSMEVTEITESTLKFVCRPGANVASYVLDVYPMSMLYNTLLDAGGVGKTSRELESMVLDMLFTAGSGGYSFDSGSLGEDYPEYEFDWVNTSYAQFNILPDAQYVIAVAACYESESALSNATALTLVYVETDEMESVGEPGLDIRVSTGYTQYVAQIIPNSDCKGYYYIDTATDMLDEFVDTFGDRCFRDLMRHWWTPNTPRGIGTEDELMISHKFSNPDPTVSHTIAAVAVDANGMPSKSYMRQDFNLKSVPDASAPAQCSYSVIENRLGASYAEYQVVLEPNCQVGFHGVLTKEAADAIAAGGEEAMAAEAARLAYEGYGIRNYSFAFDEENNVPLGEAYNEVWVDYTLSPDTEYVIVYCGRNYYQEISELRFSEPFKTLARDFSRPQDCKADLELTFTDVSVASAKFNFNYNPDYTATYRFVCCQYEEPDFSFSYSVPADDDRQGWLDVLYSPSATDYGVNLWWREASGYDGLTSFGYPVGKTTRYAYVAEDIYGVVSDVKFAEFTTIAPVGGPNPTMSVSPVFDEQTGLWSVTYSSVKDVLKFSYCLIEQGDPLLPDASILNAEGYPIDFYNAWYSGMTVGGRGLSTNYLSVSQTASQPGLAYLALCIAYGQNEDGSESVSKLYYYILTPDGEAKLLSDIWSQWKEK